MINPHLHYMLDANGNVITTEDLFEWGIWLETADEQRRVAQDRDEGPDAQDIWVSTVFTGLDYNFFDDGPPILWETMVFGGPLDGKQERYASREAALLGHQRWCQRVALALRP